MSNKYGIKNVHGEMIFFAEEENDWCTLNCCMGCRPFTMKFFNSLGQQPIELLRPWKCWCCCWYCCLQEVNPHCSFNFKHFFKVASFNHQDYRLIRLIGQISRSYNVSCPQSSKYHFLSKLWRTPHYVRSSANAV